MIQLFLLIDVFFLFVVFLGGRSLYDSVYTIEEVFFGLFSFPEHDGITSFFVEFPEKLVRLDSVVVFIDCV